MTETASQPARPSSGPGWPVFAIGAALILAAVWYFASNSERALQRGALGFNGLAAWLKAEGFDARAFNGGGTLVRGDIGLRILPLHDTDLENPRVTPTTREAVIAETSLNDIAQYTVRHKMEDHPTLVILPKWRAGVPLLGAAHRNLLIPEGEINRVAAQVGLPGAKVGRDGGGFSDRSTPDGRVGLMHRQVLRGTGCTPLIGTSDAMLLGKCPMPEDSDTSESAQRHMWVLADPDVMNNHGLRLAENAKVASAVAELFETDLPVLVDMTKVDHTAGDDWLQDRHERTWEDFARLFKWPFAMIWIAFGCLGALVLWRAVMRYGPVVQAYADEPRASKEVSIDAKARLLRLAGQDGPLLAEHVTARLAHLVAEILGPHRASDRTPLQLLERVIQRRDPVLARDLVEAAYIPPDLAPDAIIHHLDQFETCYDKVIHEFGRTPGPR
ncbi:MAG: hypothetical protein AAGH68_00860 [Pseudomonadota bacterium]